MRLVVVAQKIIVMIYHINYHKTFIVEMTLVSLRFEIMGANPETIQTYLPNIKMILSKVLKVDENILQITFQCPTSMEPLKKCSYIELSVEASNDLEKEELLTYMNPKTFVEEMNIKISEDSVLIGSSISIASSNSPISEAKKGETFIFQLCEFKQTNSPYFTFSLVILFNYIYALQLKSTLNLNFVRNRRII